MSPYIQFLYCFLLTIKLTDQAGVLSIEGAGHLGSMMTQYAVLYALARRDGKHAFLPPELDIPLRQVFLNIRSGSEGKHSKHLNCLGFQFATNIKY